MSSYTRPDIYERAAGVEPGDAYHRAWVRCSRCQFIYSIHSRPAGQLDRLYEDAYRSGIPGLRQGTTEEIFDRVVALPPEESETAERVLRLSAEMEALVEVGHLHVSNRRSVLDVGGATGVFAYALKMLGWSAEVVDPAASGAFLVQRGIAYHQAPFDPRNFEDFDLVSLVFALEHLRDPVGVLRGAGEVVHDRGAIYVEVPDAVAFELKDADDDIFNSTHLWMFDPRSLTQTFAQAGLDTLMMRRTRTLRGHFALTAIAKRRP